MPRKAEGPCIVAGCGLPKRALGYCSQHYQLQRKFGRTERIHTQNRGKICEYENCAKPAVKCGFCDIHRKLLRRSAPELQLENKYKSLWHDRKSRGLLCAEWTDFEIFRAGIGEYPGLNFSLLRKTEKLPYGPNNYRWISKEKQKSAPIVRDWADPAAEDTRRRDRNRNMYRYYGITLEQFDEMFEAQNGVCAICKQPESRKETRRGKLMTLVVDHCHKTKKVRALLCWRCNIGLGAACDSVSVLRQMIDYLRLHHPEKDPPHDPQKRR